MKLFLSWSGETSKAVAQALKEWVPLIIQGVNPWLSKQDIGAGSRWSTEIATELSAANFGIVCLTRENSSAPWIHFESGALSKSLKDGCVVPYLVDLDFSDVIGPLAQFQAKKAERTQTFELLEKINAAADGKVSGEQLKTLFEHLWPMFEGKLGAVPKASTGKPPTRETGEILEELVTLVRETDRKVSRLDVVHPKPRALFNLVKPITESDIVDAFCRIPYFKREHVEAEATRCRAALEQVGLVDRSQLQGLVESKRVLEWLENAYRDELLRPVESPLDSMGLAFWGGLLFVNDLREAVKQYVLSQIRSSEEYLQKHPSS